MRKYRRVLSQKFMEHIYSLRFARLKQEERVGKQTINAEEGVEERESSCPVGGNVN